MDQGGLQHRTVRNDCGVKADSSQVEEEERVGDVSGKLVMVERKTVGRLLTHAQSNMRWGVLVQVSAGSPCKLGFWPQGLVGDGGSPSKNLLLDAKSKFTNQVSSYRFQKL